MGMGGLYARSEPCQENDNSAVSCSVSFWFYLQNDSSVGSFVSSRMTVRASDTDHDMENHISNATQIKSRANPDERRVDLQYSEVLDEMSEGCLGGAAAGAEGNSDRAS